MLAGTTFVPPIAGVSLGHHDLSHHGQDPDKLAQLRIVEVETMKLLRDFLNASLIHKAPDDDVPLIGWEALDELEEVMLASAW